MGFVRQAGVAGTFYPAEPHILAQQIDTLLAQARQSAPEQSGPAPKALIVPHAGLIYSGPIAASAYAQLPNTMSRVVLIGPAHRLAFRGIAVPTAEAFATPFGDVPLDQAALAQLRDLPFVQPLDQAFESEHCLEVQLPFLQRVLGRFSLVPMLAGGATPEQAEAALDLLWGGGETLILISSDLSHFLDYEQARVIDGQTRSAIEHLDESALHPDQACGYVGVGGMLRLARRHRLKVSTIDVRNSGDTAGPRNQVVGYGAWAFTAEDSVASDNGASDDQILLAIARDAVRRAAVGEASPDLSQVPTALLRPGASFVTLRRQGALRGCIGSVIAQQALVRDVVENAARAALEDPRFPPLRPDELEGLDVSLSVLTAPAPMTVTSEADLLDQLRPHEDGLIIEEGTRRALFLPAVWEQVPDKRQFLAELKRKAGLAVDHWSPDCRVYRFRADEIQASPLPEGTGPGKPSPS